MADRTPVQKRTAAAALVLAASTLVGDLKCQGAFNRFATAKSVVDYASINTQRFGPFCKSHSLSKRLKEYAVSLVSRLFLFCRPLAVFRGVISVGSFPINRVFSGWGESHISNEILKNEPPFAHLYASTSIVLKICVGRLFTPSAHIAPRTIFLGNGAHLGVSVMHVGNMRHSLLKASARLSMSIDKFCTNNNSVVPAIASTQPFGVPGVCIGKFQHNKRVELLTNKVESFWHFVTLKWFTVMDAWQSAVNRFSGATLAKLVYFNTVVV